MKKRVVYTCITKNYDAIPLEKPGQGYDYVCFIDKATKESNLDAINASDDIKFVEVCIEGAPDNINRMLKIKPHEYLSNYDESIYIDGNIRLKKNPFDLLGFLPESKSIGFYLQPDRDCAFREIDELVRVGLVHGRNAKALKSSFRVLGLKASYGLYEANVIVRRHNDPSCKLFMELWWILWSNATIKRDQPYLALANFLTGGCCVHSFGYSGLRTNENTFFYYFGRLTKKGRIKRLLRRVRSELMFYKRG